jgi:hypothetical protein
VWRQTIISGPNKRLIANSTCIKKEVSSVGATVSLVQPLSSETLQTFYYMPFPTLRTTCLFAGLKRANIVFLSVSTSSLCNCLGLRAPDHSLCGKRWRLVIIVDSSTPTLRISNSVFIAECQLISREITLWLGTSRSGNAQFWEQFIFNRASIYWYWFSDTVTLILINFLNRKGLSLRSYYLGNHLWRNSSSFMEPESPLLCL